MNIYRRLLGDDVATSEAREFVEQLVAWHDAMVKHLRVLGSRPDARCSEDCPHDDAASLWRAAQEMFGARARELVFLRSHGQPTRQRTTPQVRDRAAELRV
jgi:hypothetical protein